MVLSAKLKTCGDGGWGGFLFIFFPEDSSPSTSAAFTAKKKTIFPCLSSPSAAATTKCARPIAPLISKTRSTLSICALLAFSTALLFTLSAFELEPTLPIPDPRHHSPPSSSRRQLLLKQKHMPITPKNPTFSSAALQGMGRLYRRGTKSMDELIVGHVPDDVEERELRSFLRALHFTGLLSRCDLALLFSSHASSAAGALSRLVQEENESFLELVRSYAESNETVGGRGLSRYLRVGEEAEGGGRRETIWGKETRATGSTKSSKSGDLMGTSYGSVVGFEASELDPSDLLSGFLERTPLRLRRWACYTMLLGRVKRNFKHLTLVDVKETLVVGDPFARVRDRRPESIVLWSNQETDSDKRGRRSSGPDSEAAANPGIVAGGGRGVRRFAAAVLNEIVGAAMGQQGKGKSADVVEASAVSKLVSNPYALRGVDVARSMEWIEDASSRVTGHGLLLEACCSSSSSAAVQRGHRKFDVDFALTREICSFRFYALVYKGCREAAKRKSETK